VAREVIIKTWCDIEYDREGDDQSRVDAETVTWFLYGTRMEVDLCPRHMSEMSLAQMDSIVQEHGREWEDPERPKVKSRARRKSRVAEEPVTAPNLDSRGNAYWLSEAFINEFGQFVCTVTDCSRGGEPFTKITGLRMHQRRVHDMRVPAEEKVKA